MTARNVLVAVLVLAAGLAGAMAWAGSGGRGDAATGSRPDVPAARPDGAGPTVVTAHPERGSSAARAAAVLHAWDRRRAAAYAAASASALRALYLPGSAAGRRDVRLLRRYRDRGLAVHGMRMQLLAVEVLGHRRGRWRLRVTDRLAHAVAVGRGGRVALPRDRADTREIVLVRRAGAWVVAAVS